MSKKISIEFADAWLQIIDSYIVPDLHNRTYMIKQLIYYGMLAIESKKSSIGFDTAKNILDDKIKNNNRVINDD